MERGKRKREKARQAFSATMTNRALPTIGWGIFCAASWTWCIGMFLPFVLLGQFGWPGFLAFLIPNVIGCAAFGYVLTPARQQFVRQRCAGVCLWFSLATMAYQAFFAGWMLAPSVAFGVVVVAILLAGSFGDRGWVRLAVIVTAASAVCIGWNFFSGDGAQSTIQLPASGTNPPESLLGLIPVIALGFIACPYLDLTFHRALEKSPSRHAFLVFGIVFGSTLFGVASFWDLKANGPTITFALLSLWAIQLCFTIGAHAREVRPRWRLAGIWVVLLGLALGWITRFAADDTLGDFLGGGEATYLRMLVLYGLVFPFFLLFRLRKIPDWLGWLAIAACLPFYELGFMQNRTDMLFVPIGLIFVLLIAYLDKGILKPRANP